MHAEYKMHFWEEIREEKQHYKSKLLPWLVSVSHQEFLANTMQGCVRHITVFRSGLVHTHSHAHSQNVSRCHDYNYDKSWLGRMLCQKSDGPSLESCVLVCRMCYCRAFTCVEVALWLAQGSREELFPLFPSLQVLKEIIPHSLLYKRLQMMTVWKSKIETRAFPLLFFYVWVCNLHCNLLPQWDFYYLFMSHVFLFWKN